MIHFTNKLFLPFLNLLDYYRLVDIDWCYTEDYFSSDLNPELLTDVEIISETIYKVLKPKKRYRCWLWYWCLLILFK